MGNKGRRVIELCNVVNWNVYTLQQDSKDSFKAIICTHNNPNSKCYKHIPTFLMLKILDVYPESCEYLSTMIRTLLYVLVSNMSFCKIISMVFFIFLDKGIFTYELHIRFWIVMKMSLLSINGINICYAKFID